MSRALAAPAGLSEPTPAHLAFESAEALIGQVLTDNTRFREAAHVLPEWMYEPLHGRIWAAIGAAVRSGKSIDTWALSDRLAADPSLIELGGPRYLADVYSRTSPWNLTATYAEAVVEAWTRRHGGDLLEQSRRALLTEQETPAASILGALGQSLAQLEQGVSAGDSALVSAADANGDLLDAIDHEAVHGRERGAMTGLRCFDRRMRGLRPGWLVTIGGRPSMGKSGLMRAAAYGCARKNPDSAVLVFSLEMDRREVAERALSAATYVNGDGIAYADFGQSLTPHDRQQLRACRLAMPSNLMIDDRSAVSVDDVRRRVWAEKAKRPVAGVFIDYLQLMTRPAAAGRNEASVIGDMSKGLKQLAREAETCVVVLSQLSRQVESRDDKRPHLSDLRDSGSIEQDSNAVLFPYRPAYYLERAEPRPGSAEHSQWLTELEGVRRRMDVIAAKVRGGAIGTDRQAYFAEFDHIEDVDDVVGAW